jgi:hypothetical protein
MPNKREPKHPQFFFGPVSGPHKRAAAQWDPDRKRWFQDGRKLDKLKSSYAFVWPKDGKRGSTFGRVKDIFQNSGPDIYLTKNADKLDYMANRPARDRWAGWPEFLHPLDPKAWNSMNSKKYAPWVQKGMLGGRSPGKSYDYHTRKYDTPHMGMHTGAVWGQMGWKNDQQPEAMRDMWGHWRQDPQWYPWPWGGPWENGLGRTDPQLA